MSPMNRLRRRARRSRAGSDVTEQIAAIQDSIEALGDDLNRLARRSAKASRGSALGFFGGAHDGAGNGYHTAREAALDAARYGRQMVERHPVPAAALAAGVGLIVIGLAVNMVNNKGR